MMVSTGLKGLDEVLNSLRIGDNVVWQIGDIEEYVHFVNSYVAEALLHNNRVVYIRFANHKPLVEPGENITIHQLDAHSGFDSFSRQLNSIIAKHGEGAYYVFDCLSDLLSAWANDLMIGNFFKITCPYLFQLNTLAYFSILRNNHSHKTIARIRETTQLLIDVYRFEGTLYIHPLKVWNRYSQTMFLPHAQKNGQFIPITSSAEAATLFADNLKKGIASAKHNLDYWDQLFLKAEDLVNQTGREDEKKVMIEQLCKMMIARDERSLTLAKENFTLQDLLAIKSRLAGTGFIGGKSVGMLVARNIIAKDDSAMRTIHFEPHDSFYIGSDVFYTYIVENGWWQMLMEQKTKKGYFTVAEKLREKMLTGVFPDEIKEQFQQMIEYFGQSPIIVRSSSLLEDGFGNAFAGKYESIFCANQGTPEARYAQFQEAVRKIYASTMNKAALSYRLQRGLDQADEQMALLVQRVSGSYHKNYFFPDIAGVGFSYNTFIWSNDIDPKAGMLRIVLGLGTRAVNRVEGDYPRIVALDAPLRKPHADLEDTARFSQHEIDVVNVKRNAFETMSLRKLFEEKVDIHMNRIGALDDTTVQQYDNTSRVWIITFDKLLSKTPFRDSMQAVLRILEKHYNYPVDIEFTVNFNKDERFQINLLQCRPLQTRGLGARVQIPKQIKKDKVIIQTSGYFIGGNISQPIHRIIYIDSQAYSQLSLSGKYDIARLIGKLNAGIDKEKESVLLIGPGRWGTSTPSLGVPVSFAEINNIAVLGEMAFSQANCNPELSFGTHFFQDLVESNIFYLAVFPKNNEVVFNSAFFKTTKNMLAKEKAAYKKFEHCVRVLDVSKLDARIIADVVSQRAVIFNSH